MRFLTLFLLAAAFAGAAENPAPPNMIVVLVDDMRWDDLGCTGHPFSKTPHMDRIAKEGAQFLNAFATTPLCSPSRASLLTGLYPHTHGITDNTDRSAQSHKLITFPQSLQRAGYETAFVGKWHMGNDDSPRPGFDHWVCLKGQGSSFDPELNDNGKSRKETGYVTDILHQHAMAFLKQPPAKPFLLYFAHKAAHPETVQRADGSLSDPNAANFIPAERHQNLYAGETITRRANALEAPHDKPALQQSIAGLPPLSPATGSSDESILGRLRMMAAVDESLGDMLRQLEKTGELDQTLIVVTSDHGYFYGEHGLSVERRLAYEEAIRIPLLMRLPRVIKAGSQPAEIALTLDLAPTLLELGHADAPAGLEGRSLLPIFQGAATDWRSDFLIEYFSDKVFPRIRQMGYQAIRGERWKLIHYTDLDGMDELYDLKTDPFEMQNRIADPNTSNTRQELATRLQSLLQDAPEGFTMLFDGKTWANWDHPAHLDGAWEIADGVIRLRTDEPPRVKGKDYNLSTQKRFKDFTLMIDWRLTGEPHVKPHQWLQDDGTFHTDAEGKTIMKDNLTWGDSGVYLRGARLAQVNIWCQPCGSGEIGTKFKDMDTTKEERLKTMPATRADKGPGEWNRFIITLRGDRVDVSLNGTQVIQGARVKDIPAEGSITLQNHKDAVEFRNVFIKELPQP